MNFRHLLLSILSVLFFIGISVFDATSASAADQSATIQGISIIADSMDRDSQNETVDLVGNVQVVYQGQHLSCSRAKINLRSKSIDAQGNVLYITPNATIAGARVLIEYESSTGLIYDGYVQSGNVLFEGSQIQKLSDVEYIADDARYTACTTCPEAWSFTGSKIRAEIGGYAYIKNSVMRFASVPVFWLPYIAVPLKTDRQSGLLTPSVGNRGDGGFTYSQGYFWAISRSSDATINLTNYEFRGLKTLLNYRYVLSEDSYGEFDMGMLNDRVFSEEDRLNRFRSQADRDSRSRFQRWFVKYSHYYDLPDGFIQRTQLNTASDLQYQKDFPLETPNNGAPSMESRVSLTKNTKSLHWSIDASYYQNLLQSDPLAKNDYAVHRFPEIQFSKALTPIGDTNLLASLDVKYSNFVRFGSDWDNLKYVDANSNGQKDSNEPYFHDNSGSSSKCSTIEWEADPNCHIKNDGVFTAGQDIIRTGQRLLVYPKFYYPIRYKSLEFTSSVSYFDSIYFFPVSSPNEESTISRQYARVDVGAKTILSRIYGDFSSLQSERIKHEIFPEVTATTIPWFQFQRHKFFGAENNEDFYSQPEYLISDGDLNGKNSLQYDYYDRIGGRKLLTLALTNKLIKKTWANGSPSYRQFFTWRLAQTYDLYQQEKNPNTQTPNLSSEVTLDLEPVVLSNTAVYHFLQQVSDTNTKVRLKNSKGDFIQIEQILSYAGIVDNQESTGTRSEKYVIAAQKGISWLDFIGKLGYSANPADYLSSWGYGLQVRLPGDCLYLGLTHFQSDLSKKPEYEVTVNFSWDGNKIPRLTEAVMGTFGF